MLDLFKLKIYHMMTSWNGNIFRATGHLCREFTGHRWIPCTKASDAELWCFLWSAPENGWVNNHVAGDLRHHHTHYDVIVMRYREHEKDLFGNQNLHNSERDIMRMGPISILHFQTSLIWRYPLFKIKCHMISDVISYPRISFKITCWFVMLHDFNGNFI